MVKEGINIEGARKAIELKLRKIESAVKQEFERAKEIKPATVSATCPEKFKELAERFVAIQNDKGEIRKDNVDPLDYNKVKSIKASYDMSSMKETVSLMVENAYYVDYDTMSARNIVRLLTEFEEIYNKYYEEIGYVPSSEFSSGVYHYIKKNKLAVTKEEFVKKVLEIYKPEYANVEIMDGVPKNIISGDVKESLKAIWESLRPLVKVEYERTKEIKPAAVSATCPEKFKELAERLVAIQNEKGEIKSEYIDLSDYNKLKRIKKTIKISTIKEVVNLMVENAYYINDDTRNARNIFRFLTEFKEIGGKFYAEYNGIPLNEFSYSVGKSVDAYNCDWNLGLTREEIFRTILEVYLPEFADINMLKEYNLVYLSEKQIKQIVSELDMISAGDRNIDTIFSPEHEEYFKRLCSRLKYSGYDFNAFIAKNTALRYTMCFKCNDVVSVVKKMCESYKNKYGTTMWISEIDPYLNNKIKDVKDILGEYTIRGVLLKMGIVPDNKDTSNKIIQEDEIELREKIFFDTLEKLFPDKYVLTNTIVKNDDFYNELLFLARRRKYDDINDYLASKGFTREIYRTAEINLSIFLSERDLEFYNLLDGCETIEDLEERLASLNIEFADPSEHLGIYRKLAYEKKDAEAYRQKKFKDDKEKI